MPAPPSSLRDVEQCDAVLILGEDPTNTAPRLALALRQAARHKPVELASTQLKVPAWNDAAIREVVQDEHGPGFIASPYATRLDEIATATFHGAPDDVARLGFAVARILSGDAPEVDRLAPELASLADSIASALKGAARPLIVSGFGCGSESVIRAAANVAWALCGADRRADLCLTVPESNSMGLALMNGGELAEAFRAARDGRADTIIILENDLYRRADAAVVDEFFAAAKHIVALDHLENATTRNAELVLPAGTFAESDGTLVSSEGRAQRFYSVLAPAAGVQESWRWLRDIGIAAGKFAPGTWENLDAVSNSLADALPVFKPITQIAPPAGFRIAGQKIPREPHRYSGRTAMRANVNVSEPKPPEDIDSPLKYSMEGYSGQPPSALIPFFWSPGWNSVQSVNRFQQEVGGELLGGAAGKRLIEAAALTTDYFKEIPEPFSPRDGRWLIVPIHHIFGSEELSAESQAIRELAATPYIAVGSEDALGLKVKPGEEVEVSLCGIKRRLPFKIVPSLRKGVAGMPAGLQGLEGIVLPSWGKIERADRLKAAAGTEA